MENNEEKAKKIFWKCSNCKYTLHAEEPPEICPACKTSCNFFNATSYLPEGDEAGPDRRL